MEKIKNRIVFFFIIFFFIIYPVNSHISHYKILKKIEMEILKDGKVIGYNFYFFNKEFEYNCILKFILK